MRLADSLPPSRPSSTLSVSSKPPLETLEWQEEGSPGLEQGCWLVSSFLLGYTTPIPLPRECGGGGLPAASRKVLGDQSQLDERKGKGG